MFGRSPTRTLPNSSDDTSAVLNAPTANEIDYRQIQGHYSLSIGWCYKMSDRLTIQHAEGVEKSKKTSAISVLSAVKTAIAPDNTHEGQHQRQIKEGNQR